jgi:hypothetical protein
VSPNKAQLSVTQVTYLGLYISPTHKAIMIDYKALLAFLPAPTTKAEIPSFFSLTGYLRTWVPNFSLMAKGIQGPHPRAPGPLSVCVRPFQVSLTSPITSPGTSPARPHSSFFLYVSKRQRFALGVLGHNIRPFFAPITYLSKQLDPHNQGVGPMP